MHVLMFGWEFPPHNSGGLGVACAGLARALVGKKIEIDFVLPREMALEMDSVHFRFIENISGNIRLHKVKSILHPYISSSQYLSMLSTLAQKHIYGKDLFEEVDRYAAQGGRIAKEVEDVQIIHSHDWLTFGAGMSAREQIDKPLVVHVHATEYDRTGGKIGDERVHTMEQAGMMRADRVITVSHLTKNIVTDKYGIPSSKVSVIHNGLDSSAYSLNAAKIAGLEQLKQLGYKVVLFVGRITLSKGVDHLLYALKQALVVDPKIILVIAGSGEMERQIISLSANLGISSNVFFAGWARGAELSGLYKTADLFVMPSVSEPFGLTAIEALIHNTPVLISKQSGVSEVLSHALKVDFWDTQEMANKIVSALAYPSVLQTLKINGGKQAHNCSWDKAADKCLAIYNELSK